MNSFSEISLNKTWFGFPSWLPQKILQGPAVFVKLGLAKNERAWRSFRHPMSKKPKPNLVRWSEINNYFLSCGKKLCVYFFQHCVGKYDLKTYFNTIPSMLCIALCMFEYLIMLVPTVRHSLRVYLQNCKSWPILFI